MERYVVIVAGGKGKRMNSDIPKQFLEIGSRPILFHTIDNFREVSEVKVVVVLPSDDIAFWNILVKKHDLNLLNLTIVEGGKERFDSVYKGILAIKEENVIVAIHDGVRAFATKEVIENSFLVAEEKGNAVVAVELKDSIRYSVGVENKALNRSEYRLIQTPQTFKLDLLKKAYEVGYKDFFTDDASVVEHAGHTINLIEGNYENIKITTPEDMLFAEAILNKKKNEAV